MQAQRVQRLAVLRAEHLPLQRDRRDDQLLGARPQPERAVGPGHRGHQPGPHDRVEAAVLLDLLRGPVQELARGQVRAVPLARVDRREHLRHESRDPVGSVALARDAPDLDELRDQRPDREQRDGRPQRDREAVPAHVLAHPVPEARRAGLDRLVVQVAADVGGELDRGAVAALAIAGQRLLRNVVEVAAEQAPQPAGLDAPLRRTRGGGVRIDRQRGDERRPLRRTRGGGVRIDRQRGDERRRVVLAQPAQDLVERGLPDLERLRAGQQLVEDDAQRVDVGAGVDVGHRRIGLLGAHVAERADQAADLRQERTVAAVGGDGLGDPEVDDARRRPAVDLGHEHVGGLEVAVDDRLEVGVLDPLADRHEQLQPFFDGEPLAVAVGRDREAVDVLHHEVRLPVGGRPGVEDLGDRRVLHHRQRLPLGFEALQQRAVVRPAPDQLQGDAPPDGSGLLGQPDLAHPPLADRLDQQVGADRSRTGRDPLLRALRRRAGRRAAVPQPCFVVGGVHARGWLLVTHAGLYSTARSEPGLGDRPRWNPRNGPSCGRFRGLRRGRSHTAKSGGASIPRKSLHSE